MELGSAIVAARKRKDMLQKDLALKANIPASHLSLIEQDKTEVNIRTLEAISKALEIPVPVLFFMAMSKDDVPEPKRESYGLISAMINGLIENTFLTDPKK